MRKIIGIGETILDIFFKNGQPIGAYPGGSTFNAMISLGRSGMKRHSSVRWGTTEWAISSNVS